MFKELSLERKVAIVTGAGRGIGRAISLTLAEAGADIVAVARTVQQIEETAEQVRQAGRKCLAIPTDVTRAEQVEQMVERTVSELGKVDIFVNNAGRFIMKPLVPMPDLKSPLSEIIPNFDTPTSEEEWHLLMDTNVTGAFMCIKAVGTHMIRQKKGKIIIITSMDVAKAFAYHAAYSATKGALTVLARALALEWARYNININAIGPGNIRTELSEFGYANEILRERMMRDTPLRRFLQPREVGLVAVFLASEASDYITGQTIYLDGGILV